MWRSESRSFVTVALGLFLWLTPGWLPAAERILSYDSDITVLPNASVVVNETIRVQAEGDRIKRGIYRDFPTRYKDRAGNRYRVEFAILQVLRDGHPEPYHTESRSNGVRVYIGDPGHQVPPGQHEYQLRYRTNRQIGYFQDYDELYWNVTGNGWVFPIAHASARIRLPQAVSWQQLRIAAYTGRQGSTAANATSTIVDGRTVEFATTAALGPGEGLTVALGWPKGLVAEPGGAQKVRWFLTDNRPVLVLSLGFLAALAWYLWAWNLHGRDPRKGIIIPRFEPPQGLSPAGCRYVLDMSLDRRCFTAAVVSLGVKGYLRIDEHDGDFTLFREDGSPKQAASPGEAVVFESLLPSRDDWIALDNENHVQFLAARSSLQEALAKEYKGRLFNLNTLYAVPAMVISVVGALIAVPLQPAPWLWVAYPVLSIILHLGFIALLRAPTPAGRRVMDEIEGFQMYLGTAERDRLQQMKSPQLTPEVFESFLPYAFALGVENAWCQRFQADFPDYHEQGRPYQPAWYSGRLTGASALSHIGSGFGNGLSSAISSASTPPGSSSGSGGGGSSGGGGGGGGGGGW